jgi:hypothetical protein
MKGKKSKRKKTQNKPYRSINFRTKEDWDEFKKKVDELREESEALKESSYRIMKESCKLLSMDW